MHDDVASSRFRTWPEVPPILAYDDADLRVIFQPGGSDFLLITFGDALALVDGMRFAADALARKHGLACLGFMAHHLHWFPADAIARAIPHIAYTLKSFRRILAYGSSMGAHAAIKHARVLGATEVLALAPQFSIDPAECAFDCGYHGFFTPRMAGMGIRSADLSGRIALLHDPGYALDRHHADAIAALGPSVTRIHVPSAEHHLAPMLAGSDSTFGVMQAWMQNDTAALTRLIAARRRPSHIRVRVLLARAVLRHPVLALAAIERLAQSGRIGLVEPGLHVTPLLRALIDRGEAGLAARALDVAGGVLPPVQARVLRQDLAGAPAPDNGHPWVCTHHGTAVFYDAVAGALRHRTAPRNAAEAFGLHPASLAQDAAEAPLLVRIRGAALACAPGADGRLGLVDDAGDAACLRVVRRAHGFALSDGARYACASPDGHMSCDRVEVNAWEVFSAG